MNPLLPILYGLTGLIGLIVAIWPALRDMKTHVTRPAGSTIKSALLRLIYLALVGYGLYTGARAQHGAIVPATLVCLVAGSIAGLCLGAVIALIRRGYTHFDRSGKKQRAEMARQLRGTVDAPLGFAIERRLMRGMHPSVAVVDAMAEQMLSATQTLPENTVERDCARVQAQTLQIAADAACRTERLSPDFQIDSGRLAAVVTNAVADSGLRRPL